MTINIDKNQSLLTASVVFGIIALAHLIRSIFGWSATIAGYNIPVYLSYIAVIVAGYLSWHMYNGSKT